MELELALAGAVYLVRVKSSDSGDQSRARPVCVSVYVFVGPHRSSINFNQDEHPCVQFCLSFLCVCL